MTFLDKIKKKIQSKHTKTSIVEAQTSKNTDVKYLFDLSSLDKETLYDLQYMVGKELVRYDEEMSVMYAGRYDDNSIYCVFLKTAGTKITIYANTMKDGIIKLHPKDTFTVDMFYAYEKEDFLEKLCELKRVVPIRKEEVRQAIWDALLIKFPDYNTKKSPRSSIFEKYFPFSLDNFVGAEKYSNSGILYKMLKPVSEDNEMMEFQKWNIFNMGTENESKCLQEYYCTCPYPQTEEDFLSECEEVFAREELSVLEHIPHKIIYLDDQDSKNCGSMGFEANYREMHIYESKSDMSIVVLKIYSVYNGHPSEGGRMEGYTFTRKIETPSAEYHWSDEELINKYKDCFEE